jgi:hypothetical protein
MKYRLRRARWLMAVSTSISFRGASQVLLRWREAPKATSHEELVELIKAHRSKAVLRSACAIAEMTKVYLVQENTRIGIVQSCRQQGNSFILNITISDNPVMEAGSQVDPGIFAVDDFVTEEQEAEILRDLDEQGPMRAPY